MKKIPEKIREVSHKLRSLTSLIQAEYQELLPIFSVHCEEKLSLYTLKDKPRTFRRFKERSDSSLYGSEAKLDFLLTYLKNNPLQGYQGLLFEMSQSKVSEWLSFLLPVLEKSLAQMGFLAQEGFSYNAQKDMESSYFSADVTEREIAETLIIRLKKKNIVVSTRNIQSKIWSFVMKIKRLYSSVNYMKAVPMIKRYWMI